MPKLINLTGKKFGRLLVIEKLNNDKYNKIRWLCLCDCGNIKIIIGERLRSGHTKSCGCLNKEIITKHGYSNTRIYHIWENMIQRCTNIKNKEYKNYGGRISPIVVCDRWLDKNNGFINFLEDMGEPPSAQHQIDRIDNNKGYFKENCRWTSRKNNNRNKRNNHMLEYNNKNQCVAKWSDETGIPYQIIYSRIKSGWSTEETLTIPVKKYKKKIK